MAKVFIGNLPDRAKGEDVEDFFYKFGRIREINLKSGFGFVEFEDRRDAEDAVYERDGARLVGEKVTVELAGREKRSRSRSRGRNSHVTSHWDRRSPQRSRQARGNARPHRTQWALRIENLSSSCR